jgi:AP-1 complex subunit beta-1
MEKKAFLGTWKDIPAGNETQYTIEDVECTSDGISTKMGQNNVSISSIDGKESL